jgi:hypothetical protein
MGQPNAAKRMRDMVPRLINFIAPSTAILRLIPTLRYSSYQSNVNGFVRTLRRENTNADYISVFVDIILYQSQTARFIDTAMHSN